MESEWLNELSHRVIGAAREVYQNLGPGLAESAYIHCLRAELCVQGLGARCNVRIPIRYKTWNLEDAFNVDLLVDNALVVSVKSVEHLLPLHSAQLQTYLKLSGFRLGLLINFSGEDLLQGIRRVVNEL
ncbi:MAG: GxxExxY protein [Zoogloeaceae bacterium]|nr:GxxExxY protein [Zoogloeaceae bacterium]